MERYRVEIREYEKGWGSKVDEIKEFDTYEEAVEFCEEFNAKNNLPRTPDYYEKATILN